VNVKYNKTEKGIATRFKYENSIKAKMVRYNYLHNPATKPKLNKRIRNQRYKNRIIMLQIYSNGMMTCKNCGCDNIDCLDIDHINNDGASDRKNKHLDLYRSLTRLEDLDYFQVLCRNCNWLKQLENKSKNWK
jgi:ribosomal protein L35